jgi:hypothetical protein
MQAYLPGQQNHSVSQAPCFPPTRYRQTVHSPALQHRSTTRGGLDHRERVLVLVQRALGEAFASTLATLGGHVWVGGEVLVGQLRSIVAADGHRSRQRS